MVARKATNEKSCDSYVDRRIIIVKNSLFRCASTISFSFDYDNKLPIVLFVGQHFSGSLFEWVHLSI